MSATTIVFVWIVAFPVGVYSALNHYSFGDYFFTFLGFLGRAIPNFMLALFIMYFALELFGVSTWGLFSQEYADAPWSLAKFLDLLQHLVVPVIVLGTAGTAGVIRVMRANLLDELSKQYVVTARAKGLARVKVVWKYPIRIALNPFISTVGWILPQLISGAAIVSVVLNLPTTGPLFLNALRTQDMYLAGSFLMMLSALTVIGTLISDLLLAWVDPRIRYR
jgi:peptide/nickel transport system permease protein